MTNQSNQCILELIFDPPDGEDYSKYDIPFSDIVSKKYVDVYYYTDAVMVNTHYCHPTVTDKYQYHPPGSLEEDIITEKEFLKIKNKRKSGPMVMTSSTIWEIKIHDTVFTLESTLDNGRFYSAAILESTDDIPIVSEYLASKAYVIVDQPP